LIELRKMAQVMIDLLLKLVVSVIGTKSKIRNTVRAIPSETEKDKVHMAAGPEFPGDDDGLRALMDAPDWGENSILRFADNGIGIDIKGYKYWGSGDRLHRLTFVLIENMGFVYVRGKGRVVSPKGEIFEF
jgi:hypothetical protein